MKSIQWNFRRLLWPAAMLLAAALAGCGGGSDNRDPILGTGAGAVLPPTVSATAPIDNATGVPGNLQIVTANFSERIAPLGNGTSFVVSCTAPCANPTGTLTLDSTGRIVTYTLAPGTVLSPSTLYTITITAAVSAATGVAMVAPYVSHFTTGVTVDSTRPRVTATVPATTVGGPTPSTDIGQTVWKVLICQSK